MAKELVFLQCSEQKDKSQFLRNVHNLVHFPVDAKTTYEDLFEAIESKWDSGEAYEAAKAWVTFSKAEVSDPAQWKEEVLHIVPDPGIKMFAIFDLRNV